MADRRALGRLGWAFGAVTAAVLLMAAAVVTSHLDGVGFPGDTRFGKWREAGLPKPSVVRLAKVVAVEHALIRKKLGTVHASDKQAIRHQFRRVFAELA